MIINANALHVPLADKSVQCIVTSPPYWGLRNYGVNGQLGLERTPEEYISNMVAVFRECWRVMRDDATLWLNLGDSYAGNKIGNTNGTGAGGLSTGKVQQKDGVLDQDFYKELPPGPKPKDLVGIPWRLAFALQAEGWYLRSDIIWSKPNPMPESVTDRPTKSHEYLFLLAKQERYYYDAETIKEDAGENTHSRGNGDGGPKRGENSGDDFGVRKWGNLTEIVTSRNRRTVWTIPTAPYKGAHFATFPPALVEPCIKAGTSERGACPKCGKGWRRIVEKSKQLEPQRNVIGIGPKTVSGGGNGTSLHHIVTTDTLGWQPSCTCDAGEPIPCLVFDPFVGSGTTVKVAYDLGRRGVGLDLSLDYLDEQARKRIHNGHTARLF